MSILKAEGIYKSFQQGQEETPVLNNISFDMAKVSFVAVMGASGSGKSTLLNILSTIDQANQGKVYFDGQDLTTLNEDQFADLRRQKMGFIFQQPTLLNKLNILDNIVLPHSIQNNNIEELRNKALDLMKSMKIDQLKDRDINQASGGQLQRVGICRAILGDPQIIFADEPTGALNSQTAQEVMDLLIKINQAGTSILMVTHDPNMAVAGQRCLLMKDGQIIQDIDFLKLDLDQKSDKVSYLNQALIDNHI